MATRHKTQQDKEALKEMVRARCRTGELRAGDRLPTLRELTTQYSLSMPTVAEALRDLVDEGALYFLPRVGTFVGPKPREAGGTFLFVTPYSLSANVHLLVAHRAFESTIAARGGSCLTLGRVQVAQLQAGGALPCVAGVFEFAADAVQSGVQAENELEVEAPRVVYLEGELCASCDSVDFDQFDGGRRATLHLLARGHGRVAFLGLHSATGGFVWSRQREEGWREALLSAQLDSNGLTFLPSHFDVKTADQKLLTRHALQRLLPALRLGEVEAVVAVNLTAARELFAALNEGDFPEDAWPSVVSFDDPAEGDSHLVSTLNLPWEELGRVAAEVLLARACGSDCGPARQRLLSMNLVPRLTCEPHWSHPPEIAALTMAASAS